MRRSLLALITLCLLAVSGLPAAAMRPAFGDDPAGSSKNPAASAPSVKTENGTHEREPHVKQRQPSRPARLYWVSQVRPNLRPYPGKELNGTWQIIKHDYRGIKDMNSPAVKDFFDPSKSSINALFLLPDGQKIGFWLTGGAHTINPIERPNAGGMDIGMKLIFPLDASFCKPGAWDYLCDEKGNLDLNRDSVKKRIKDNAYIVATEDEAWLNQDFLPTRALSYIKQLWPNIKNYRYNVNIMDGLNSFDIHPMKNGNEILIPYFLHDGSRMGVLLRRVK